MNRSHPPETTERAMLIDPFGRRIDYVRLSITDRCNLRCLYCMPERQRFLPRAQLLTLEEIARLGRCFSELGVTRVRVTGGEPLVRRNALWLFERLGELAGIRDLTLTTNATRLAPLAPALVRAGVRRVNISLDTLRPARFHHLTRGGRLDTTLAGIDAALAAGFQRVSLNSVILTGYNHDEVCDLVAFAIDRGIDIRFIEEMPLGVLAGRERAPRHCPSETIRNALERHHRLLPSTAHEGGPARYFLIAGTASRVGFISPHSHDFCAECNRVRVTTAGRLLLCLGQTHSVDLRRVLRAHPDDDQPVRRAIVAAMALKPRGHAFSLVEPPRILRHMNHSGG
ncbi:GTP 3',8-cyclase MoaA [Marichromatium bheemlicum]|uniref:GTP 3',8-cyclase n=1 Tax=Marichromatium bheemlicum TaxID=365339 RepID=A0ABX1I943_9GAMM|nr:GTP 3',8-cyclase MoaA [Marichromatium bheemlicum]NKN33721.1 GTP 3',8-cyclase MoaA [Marichromatium bheemlicum]